MKVYLAGPMSGIPYFNFPEFQRVAKLLRQARWDVVSPAELDEQDSVEKAGQSTTGQMSDAAHSWGHYLSRDVRIIADEGIEGIVLLPGWVKSRGARLEASVGLLMGPKFKFYQYIDDVVEMKREQVALNLFVENCGGLK